MLRSYKVVGRFAVTDKFGFTHDPEFYQKIHHNVLSSRQAWEEATEEIIKRAERRYGKGCKVEILNDFNFLRPKEKEKPVKLPKREKPHMAGRQTKLFKEIETDREIILETRRKLETKAAFTRKMKWDLMKDRMTDEEIKAVKDGPFEPENRWALAEWKKRAKAWIDKLQLKLFN